jgi:hypothetical protein
MRKDIAAQPPPWDKKNFRQFHSDASVHGWESHCK